MNLCKKLLCCMCFCAQFTPYTSIVVPKDWLKKDESRKYDNCVRILDDKLPELYSSMKGHLRTKTPDLDLQRKVGNSEFEISGCIIKEEEDNNTYTTHNRVHIFCTIDVKQDANPTELRRLNTDEFGEILGRFTAVPIHCGFEDVVGPEKSPYFERLLTAKAKTKDIGVFADILSDLEYRVVVLYKMFENVSKLHELRNHQKKQEETIPPLPQQKPQKTTIDLRKLEHEKLKKIFREAGQFIHTSLAGGISQLTEKILEIDLAEFYRESLVCVCLFAQDYQDEEFREIAAEMRGFF